MFTSSNFAICTREGSAEFPYALTIEVSEPFFKLFADTDKTLVTPTTAGVVFVRAERHNGASGEIELMVDRLPPGVIAHMARSSPGKGKMGCIVFEAAEGTKHRYPTFIFLENGDERSEVSRR